jgi:hypothetical protein
MAFSQSHSPGKQAVIFTDYVAYERLGQDKRHMTFLVELAKIGLPLKNVSPEGHR